MFRFTIRDVLWLTVVVALALGLGLGWWQDHRTLTAKVAEAEYATIKYDVLMAAIGAAGWRAELDSRGDLKLFPASQQPATQQPATLNRR